MSQDNVFLVSSEGVEAMGRLRLFGAEEIVGDDTLGEFPSIVFLHIHGRILYSRGFCRICRVSERKKKGVLHSKHEHSQLIAIKRGTEVQFRAADGQVCFLYLKLDEKSVRLDFWK